jgi:hypothetical protein
MSLVDWPLNLCFHGLKAPIPVLSMGLCTDLWDLTMFFELICTILVCNSEFADLVCPLDVEELREYDPPIHTV